MNEELLILLRKGCNIIYPSGYSLIPDLKTNYIELGFINDTKEFVSDGLEPLSLEGLERCLNWKKEWEDEQ
jgi:hypothetical protein